MTNGWGPLVEAGGIFTGEEAGREEENQTEERAGERPTIHLLQKM